ncbi:hypothetical protein ACFQY5_37700 [Paeniroseomonas aquatica]|uniref:Uncharacterized protein n=1 Tax=Paeniroseomonas aquatica TaxID=373043 RepID=A0ABT7ZZW6_9PROT|nr:hypothetical protein [Paeniroseomonas aquatica]MDN3562986.1 hypothetical protein [Paeniroseomonas aquatica]
MVHAFTSGLRSSQFALGCLGTAEKLRQVKYQAGTVLDSEGTSCASVDDHPAAWRQRHSAQRCWRTGIGLKPKSTQHGRPSHANAQILAVSLHPIGNAHVPVRWEDWAILGCNGSGSNAEEQ